MSQWPQPHPEPPKPKTVADLEEHLYHIRRHAAEIERNTAFWPMVWRVAVGLVMPGVVCTLLAVLVVSCVAGGAALGGRGKAPQRQGGRP